MNRYIIILLLLIFANSCDNAGGGRDNQGINVTSDIFLGKIVKGEKQVFVIKCINNNNRAIKLREINVHCTCLKIMGRYDRQIPPRDSATFQFEYLPEGNSYTEKKIELYFDDSKIPLTTKVSAHIRVSL